MFDLYLKAYDDVTLALVGRLPIIVVPALGDIVNVVITLLEPDKLPPNMNNKLGAMRAQTSPSAPTSQSPDIDEQQPERSSRRL